MGRRRAEAFFDTFVAELAARDQTEQSLSSLEPMLAEMLGDELKSQVLFDAYRRVSLSASPSIGPRIIAVLTARLIAANRVANADEERLMLSAEILNDRDVVSFCIYLSEHPLDKGYELKLFDAADESNALHRAMRIGPVNVAEEVGNWCLKLQSTGLVVQDVATEARHYRADLESHIDTSGTITTYVWLLRFRPEVLELKSIIEGLGGLPQ
jgi:hypothetical protein